MPNPSLTPALLLRAYAMGIFPMAESREATEIHWVDPRHRGVFPLDGFHISRNLRRHILQAQVQVTVDTAFDAVVQGCAGRETTWINSEIALLYGRLHAMGHAHSLEVWADGQLIGGVYGVVIGAAFFGESMFSRATNASKIALAYLMHRLQAGGFKLFDTQFLTPHLASMGAVEIPRATYQRRLMAAIAAKADFVPPGYPPEDWSVAVSAGAARVAAGASQRSTQTS